MPIQEKDNKLIVSVSEDVFANLGFGNFVTVAIPESMEQSKMLKADLEAQNIPALLEQEITEMDAVQLGGTPVLVPESKFEEASEIIGMIELNALDDEDEDDFDFDDDDLDDLDDDLDDEDWDEDDDLDDDWDEDEDLDDDFDIDDELDDFDDEE